MATPDQIKRQINNEYLHLKARAERGEINESCISGIIERRCMDGARHNGIPEYWREYLPRTGETMTEDQLLLIQAQEECAELSQAIAKALRFGMDDQYPDVTSPPNVEKIRQEYNDLQTLINMLCERGVLPAGMESQMLQRAKREKVARYLHYSKERGILDEY